MDNTRKVITLSAIGGALEFYDFMVFSLLSSSIAQSFFPHASSVNALLMTFSTFTVGYLARPLGALVFGHIGDRYGRKVGFLIALLLMAVPSLAIAILPGYDIIGVLAPVLLVACRLLQGLAIGGEIPGAIVFVMEHVQKKQLGLAIALLFLGFNLATFGAQLMVVLIQCLEQHHVIGHWGWRLAFLLSAVLAFVGFYLRRALSETPTFLQYQKKMRGQTIPAWHLCSKHHKNLLSGTVLIAAGAVTFFLLFVYLPSLRLFHQGQPLNIEALGWLNTMNLAIFSLLLVVAGFVVDHWISRERLLRISYLIAAVVSPLSFHWMLHGMLWQFCVGLGLLSLPAAMISATYGAQLASLFPVEVRYSGVALAYSLAFAIFGGTTPLVATLLLTYFPPEWFFLYPAVFMLLGFWCVRTRPISASAVFGLR